MPEFRKLLANVDRRSPDSPAAFIAGRMSISNRGIPLVWPSPTMMQGVAKASVGSLPARSRKGNEGRTDYCLVESRSANSPDLPVRYAKAKTMANKSPIEVSFNLRVCTRIPSSAFIVIGPLSRCLLGDDFDNVQHVIDRRVFRRNEICHPEGTRIHIPELLSEMLSALGGDPFIELRTNDWRPSGGLIDALDCYAQRVWNLVKLKWTESSVAAHKLSIAVTKMVHWPRIVVGRKERQRGPTYE